MAEPKHTGKSNQRDEAKFDGTGESHGNLLESTSLYKLLVDSVLDYAIFALDSTGHILTWNAGAERLKGYTREEIVGQHFSIFYPQEAKAIGHPEYELRVANAEGRFEEEGWRIRKDGSRFWANVVITALRGEEGELVGFAKVTRDLTERRAAELRSIEDARRIAEAEAANRAKSEFLTAMSHELRTPLNAIGGYTDLLTLGIHGPITAAQIEALDRIRVSQRHLLGLITDLLNFTKIEAGRLNYHIEPVKLGLVVEIVRPMVEPQAAAKNIRIDWPPTDDSVVAEADERKAEQIALNLLTNSVKYTLDGGQIRVRYFRIGEQVAFEVQDTGIGIAEDQQEAVFEPFVQVGRGLTSIHDGAGLGLAISRDLARAMGGDITVHSVASQGSTFTMLLPARSS